MASLTLPSSKALLASATALTGLYWLSHHLDLPSLYKSTKTDNPEVIPRCYSRKSKPSLEAFRKLLNKTTFHTTYPLASEIQKNIPIYNCANFDYNSPENSSLLDSLQNELYHILISGPGVFIMQNFYTNLNVIDAANKAYELIIAREKEDSNRVQGDHFAASAANSRIWNSFSKHAEQDAESFVAYFSNPWLKIVCEAYLGPAYQITSQVNIVHPGGKAQMPHRDYHLGFQTDEDVVKWPKAVHAASSLLTLQGAVAHTDMPLDSGPTRLLPYSQLFEEGFRSYRSKEFVEYFERHYIALPLKKGDAIFFNPALFHAAGENYTRDFSRSANLLQVSSAFGKTMETTDSLEIVERTYELLVRMNASTDTGKEVDALVCSVAQGYPFPTNLDRRPPAPGGQAPESEEDVLRRALEESWDKARVMRELRHMRMASSASGRA